MKLKELINILTEFKNEHGNIDVVVQDIERGCETPRLQLETNVEVSTYLTKKRELHVLRKAAVLSIQ